MSTENLAAGWLTCSSTEEIIKVTESFEISHFRFKRQQTVSVNVLTSYALVLISHYETDEADDDDDSGNDEDCVDL